MLKMPWGTWMELELEEWGSAWRCPPVEHETAGLLKGVEIADQTGVGPDLLVVVAVRRVEVHLEPEDRDLTLLVVAVNDLALQASNSKSYICSMFKVVSDFCTFCQKQVISDDSRWI